MIRTCWGGHTGSVPGSLLGSPWEPTGRDCSGFCVLSCLFLLMPRFSKLNCRAVFVPFFPVESENAKLGGLVSSPTGGRPKGHLSQNLIEWVRAGGGQQFQVGWVGGSPIPHSFIHLRNQMCS